MIFYSGLLKVTDNIKAEEMKMKKKKWNSEVPFRIVYVSTNISFLGVAWLTDLYVVKYILKNSYHFINELDLLQAVAVQQSHTMY